MTYWGKKIEGCELASWTPQELKMVGANQTKPRGVEGAHLYNFVQGKGNNARQAMEDLKGLKGTGTFPQKPTSIQQEAPA